MPWQLLLVFPGIPFLVILGISTWTLQDHVRGERAQIAFRRAREARRDRATISGE